MTNLRVYETGVGLERREVYLRTDVDAEIERLEARVLALTQQLLETGGELGKVQAHNKSLREALDKRVAHEPSAHPTTNPATAYTCGHPPSAQGLAGCLLCGATL